MSINRFSLLIALTVIAALAVLTISMVTAPRHPVASREYEQVELNRAARYRAAAVKQAHLDQRRGEQTTAKYIDPQQVLQEFRHSEQTTGHIYNAQQAFL